MDGLPGSLFESVGSRFVPTDLARGPWSPDALHGGPVAALIARAIDGCEPVPRMQVARLTVELLRPVPIAALAVDARVVRPGKRVQLVDVRVSQGDTDVAWGRAVRMLPPGHGGSAEEASYARDLEAEASLVGSHGAQVASGILPPELAVAAESAFSGYPAFHNSGAELRFAKGSFGNQGPATAWMRLRCPVLPDEEPSPLQRVAAAADFGNGISAELEFGRDLFINPDLTIYVYRMPVGEWICLDARTWIDLPSLQPGSLSGKRHAGAGPLRSRGIGMAESALSDISGPIGRSIQSLIVESGRTA